MENAALAAEKPRFIRERSFYHTLLTIAVPIVLQNRGVFNADARYRDAR